MNMQRIIEAIFRGEIPEGYTKHDLGDGTFVFERIEQKRENHGKTLGETLSQHLQTIAGENIAKAREQQELESMFKHILRQKTFDLGNAYMCNLPRSVLKVLKMLLNGAGEAAIHNDERAFDEQIDAFNSLMLASGVKINCL